MFLCVGDCALFLLRRLRYRQLCELVRSCLAIADFFKAKLSRAHLGRRHRSPKPLRLLPLSNPSSPAAGGRSNKWRAGSCHAPSQSQSIPPTGEGKGGGLAPRSRQPLQGQLRHGWPRLVRSAEERGLAEKRTK